MARKRVTVEDWVREALKDPDKGKACSAISLVHMRGSSQEEVHTKQFEGETVDGSQLAARFVDKASGYCQDMSGIQTFRLLAFYSQNEPQAAFPFTMVDGQLTAGQETGFSKFDASPQGERAMLMKNNVDVMSMFLDLAKSTFNGGVEREAALRRELAEAHVILRDVFFNMKKEVHEQRLAELSFSRQTEERKLIAKALPTVLNHLTGREIMPESHADSELIEAIAMKVKPDQIQQLVALGIIPQEIGGLLAARFQKVYDQRKEQSEALRQLPPENSEKAKP